MCNCRTMRRTWEETQNGRFAPSNHAPACEDYETKRYICLFDDDGRSFIDTVENQYSFMSHDDGNWRQSDIYITEDQFNKLQEYVGL